VTTGLGDRVYWAGHIARHAPGLALTAVPLMIARRSYSPAPDTKMLVATHHKVLTVFLSRVFRSFAALTARSFDLGPGGKLDYSRTVLIDHKSTIDWSRLPDDTFGLHVVRDPRDVLVSSAFYHVKSSEPWLHKPMPALDGCTYQETITALPNVEERILFEINNSTGRNIRSMLAWPYGRPGIEELRYDELVGDKGAERFARAIAVWPLTDREKDLLIGLFGYFSLAGPGMSARHVRNPSPGQWQEHFTPRVEQAFREAFPDAVERLGFSWPQGD